MKPHLKLHKLNLCQLFVFHHLHISGPFSTVFTSNNNPLYNWQNDRLFKLVKFFIPNNVRIDVKAEKNESIIIRSCTYVYLGLHICIIYMYKYIVVRRG